MAFNGDILLTGIIITAARTVDMTLGTLRTISTVHGKKAISFFLGFTEILIWILVVSAVMDQVKTEPILAVFYALGFSSGTAIGIYIEQKLAFGYVAVRIFSHHNADKITNLLREKGYSVTSFIGEGKDGPVTEIYIVCRRKELAKILSISKSVEPDAFYSVEQAKHINKLNGSGAFWQPPTGWRAVTKIK